MQAPLLAVIAGSVFGCIILLPTLVFVLLPLQVLMDALRATHATAYAAAGVLLGAVFGILAFKVDTLRFTFGLSLIEQIIVGGAAGATATLVFWLFLRPDRDPPPTQSNTAP